MNHQQFAHFSETMAEELVHDINTTLGKLYEKFGPENVNPCFGNALAIATGNVLSAYCIAYQPERKEAFRCFEKVFKASAKKHREWKISKSH